MLDKGIIERIVLDYKDIYKQALEDNFQSPSELPYFEGDFWPNVIEETIRELDQAEEAVSGDLNSKVFAAMAKYKEVFFKIRLHSAQSAASLGPIHDPDPLMQVQGEKVRFQTFDLSTNGCSIFVLIKRNSSKSSCSHIMSANFGGIQSPHPTPPSSFVSICQHFNEVPLCSVT